MSGPVQRKLAMQVGVVDSGDPAYDSTLRLSFSDVETHKPVLRVYITADEWFKIVHAQRAAVSLSHAVDVWQLKEG